MSTLTIEPQYLPAIVYSRWVSDSRCGPVTAALPCLRKRALEAAASCPPRAPAAGPGHAEAHQVAQTVTRVIMQPAIPKVTLPRRDGLAQLVVPRLSMLPVIPAPQPRAPGRHLRISGDDRGRLRPVTHQI